jgi:hypothetical protein
VKKSRRNGVDCRHRSLFFFFIAVVFFCVYCMSAPAVGDIRNMNLSESETSLKQFKDKFIAN